MNSQIGKVNEERRNRRNRENGDDGNMVANQKKKERKKEILRQ